MTLAFDDRKLLPEGVYEASLKEVEELFARFQRSDRRIKEYGFDMVLVGEGTEDEQHWLSFFGQVNLKWCQQFGWPDRSTKGVVKVVL